MHHRGNAVSYGTVTVRGSGDQGKSMQCAQKVEGNGSICFSRQVSFNAITEAFSCTDHHIPGLGVEKPVV